MQIVDNTPQSYAPLLKVTLRELIDCAPAQHLKGIRLMFWEIGGDTSDESRVTTRYSHQNGQAVVHVELDAILRLTGLEWRPWALGRRTAHALSFALANHAVHHGGVNRAHLATEARRIQVELLKSWSERLIARMTLPSFAKRLMSAFVARRLAAIAEKRT
jgi:hypothetical protein